MLWQGETPSRTAGTGRFKVHSVNPGETPRPPPPPHPPSRSPGPWSPLPLPRWPLVWFERSVRVWERSLGIPFFIKGHYYSIALNTHRRPSQPGQEGELELWGRVTGQSAGNGLGWPFGGLQGFHFGKLLS